VNVIDLNGTIKENFTCLKTNQLFKVIRTTICVHNITDFISGHFISNINYEDEYMHVLFRIMLRYPHFALIDIGANIGTYTMFAAAMNRLVIAIECFKPNYMRIARAIQIENVRNNVILIGNAINTYSGQYMKISSHSSNIGGQRTYDLGTTNITTNNLHIAKTIRLDDILPIIEQTKFRSFLLKVDIEGSEYHVFASGSQFFDKLDVPIILMEWDKINSNKKHGDAAVEFLIKRGYIPTTDTCQELNMTIVFTGWPANVFWTKMNRSDIC